METLTATFKIVTPMFLGDAQQNAVDIRPPSVKGALRFWWRAMMWGKVLQEAEGDEVIALRCLHRREAELFGSAAGEKTGGQGKFLLRVENEQVRIEHLKNKKLKNDESGLQYLLGLGLYNFNAGYIRNALAQEQEFSILLNFRGEIDTSIIDALKLFGLLGGLGSRSRRGFGSVTLQSIWKNTCKKDDIEKETVFSIPKNEDEYTQHLKSLLTNLPKSLTSFSAFSATSRIDISMRGKTAWDILNSVGKQMLLYRSWGKSGKAFGNTKSEQRFAGDHHLMSNVLNGSRHSIPKDFNHPERVVFGLPHNYFFSSTGRKVELAPTQSEQNRRASPLLIHIHEFPDKSCIAIHILFTSLFLPSKNQLQIGKNLVSINPEWRVLEEYLNRSSFLKKSIIP